MKIIGLVGHPGAGKDVVAEYLESKGFFRFSGGDHLRKVMREQGLPTDRSSIREFATKMREIHGNAFLVEESACSIKGNTVISGFRNMAAVDVFRKMFPEEFMLVSIEAPIEMRYERVIKRRREGDDISFERFKEEEENERSSDSGAYEVDAVMTAADIHIENTGSKEELFTKIDKIIL